MLGSGAFVQLGSEGCGRGQREGRVRSVGWMMHPYFRALTKGSPTPQSIFTLVPGKGWSLIRSLLHPHPGNEVVTGPGMPIHMGTQLCRHSLWGRPCPEAADGEGTVRPTPHMQSHGKLRDIPFLPSPEVNSFGKNSWEIKPR